MPVSSTQDILYVVLSVCAIWATVFLCWLLYQAAKVLKNANKIMDATIEKLEYISSVVTFMREKVDNVSKHMGSMSGLLSGLLEKFVVNKLSSKLEEKITKKKVSSSKK